METTKPVPAMDFYDMLEVAERKFRDTPYGNLRQSTDNDIKVLTALFEKEAETE